jgi:hypothetical protein
MVVTSHPRMQPDASQYYQAADRDQQPCDDCGQLHGYPPLQARPPRIGARGVAGAPLRRTLPKFRPAPGTVITLPPTTRLR